MIHTRDDQAVTAYLASPVVDARIELVSRLGGTVLAELRPRAGVIVWDTTERRGRLDLDVIAEPILHARHPIANLGQVLEARWVWPELGITVPCGRWLISEPGERTEQIWQVSADPEGPARLARAAWWEPGGRVISGSLWAQIGQMMTEARIPWTPPSSERGAPATECAAGDSVLSSVQKVLDHCEVDMRPDRSTNGVVLSNRRDSRPDWTWSDDTPPVHRVTGSHATAEIPNRVTVWFEEESDGVRTVKGWSEPLMTGPRRWDGPYGRKPLTIKLDGPATQADMRAQAIRELRNEQTHDATVRVEMMHADPRIEVGDIARILSPASGTDCLARVTSNRADAATGMGVVECAALSGTVAGVPATYV